MPDRGLSCRCTMPLLTKNLPGLLEADMLWSLCGAESFCLCFLRIIYHIRAAIPINPAAVTPTDIPIVALGVSDFELGA